MMIRYALVDGPGWLANGSECVFQILAGGISRSMSLADKAVQWTLTPWFLIYESGFFSKNYAHIQTDGALLRDPVTQAMFLNRLLQHDIRLGEEGRTQWLLHTGDSRESPEQVFIFRSTSPGTNMSDNIDFGSVPCVNKNCCFPNGSNITLRLRNLLGICFLALDHLTVNSPPRFLWSSLAQIPCPSFGARPSSCWSVTPHWVSCSSSPMCCVSPQCEKLTVDAESMGLSEYRIAQFQALYHIILHHHHHHHHHHNRRQHQLLENMTTGSSVLKISVERFSSSLIA